MACARTRLHYNNSNISNTKDNLYGVNGGLSVS